MTGTGIRLSAHLGYLFGEMPLRNRFAAARRAGFEGVEHPAPYTVPAGDMAALLRGAGLPYVQFGLPNGDTAKGEKGIAIFPDRRAEFRASLDIGLRYAEATGTRILHAMAGVLAEGLRLPEHRACYIENLSLAAHEAAKRGITIMIEAMSPGAVPDYYLGSPDEARGILDEVDQPNLGLLLDVFHTAAIGADPAQAIVAQAGRIAHVHVADYPMRHEPGSGMIDFAAVLAALRVVRYSGFIGGEYHPAAGTQAGLGWLRDFRRATQRENADGL